MTPMRSMMLAVALTMTFAEPAMASECSDRLQAMQAAVEEKQDLSEDIRAELMEILDEARVADKEGDIEACQAALDDIEDLLASNR